MFVYSRRAFLKAAAAVLPASHSLLALSAPVRALHFTHTHTGERLAIEYFRA